MAKAITFKRIFRHGQTRHLVARALGTKATVVVTQVGMGRGKRFAAFVTTYQTALYGVLRHGEAGTVFAGQYLTLREVRHALTVATEKGAQAGIHTTAGRVVARVIEAK